MSAQDKPINLADPDFEPTDADLRRLWRRAVDGLEEQHRLLHRKRLDEALRRPRGQAPAVVDRPKKLKKK